MSALTEAQDALLVELNRTRDSADLVVAAKADAEANKTATEQVLLDAQSVKNDLDTLLANSGTPYLLWLGEGNTGTVQDYLDSNVGKREIATVVTDSDLLVVMKSYIQNAGDSSTLPASPSVGQSVIVTFIGDVKTSPCVLSMNSEKMAGNTDATTTIDSAGTFVFTYTGATYGWSF